MGTSNTFLKNATTRHAVYVQRYAGSQYKEMLPYLERVRRNTVARLRDQNLSEATRTRLNKILKEIDVAAKDTYDAMNKGLISNFQEFGDYEADFSARMFTRATLAEFEKPATILVQAAVISKPILLTDDTLSVTSVLREFSKKKRKDFITTIKDGIIAGKTNQEIVNDINTISKKTHRLQAKSLVRTVTNHVSSTARQLTMQENDDIIEKYQWISTLDGRTTFTCQSLDGKIFEKGKGPTPPLHWGCRSTIVPLVKPEYKIFDKEKSKRVARVDGKSTLISGQTTYNSWLKTQSNEFQEEVLGPKRAALFRKGGLSLNQFVDERYEPLTLEQLKRKEPLAFEKAGLDE